MPITIGEEIITNLPKTNSLSLLINNSEYLEYGFIRNNSRMKVYFDSKYWETSRITLTGKMNVYSKNVSIHII